MNDVQSYLSYLMIQKKQLQAQQQEQAAVAEKKLSDQLKI